MENISKIICLNGNYFHIFVSQSETYKTMNKEKKKKPKYNQAALEALGLKYGLTNYYIRQCISGAKTGITPDTVKKDYKILCDALKTAEKSAVKKFNNQ